MPDDAGAEGAIDTLLAHLMGPAGAPAAGAGQTPDWSDQTTLREAGLDSLASAELAIRLEQRLGRPVSDATLATWQTLGDVRRFISPPVPVPSFTERALAAPRPTAETTVAATRDPLGDLPPPHRVARVAATLATVGVFLGVALGLGWSALLGAAGLGDTALPPLASSTPTATATPSPTDEPTESIEPTDEATPTLNASAPRVAPGDRLTLEGIFPGAPEGTALQVQAREPGAAWSDFPVQAVVRGDTTYATQVFTTRTGAREFRLVLVGTDRATPTVTVTVG